MAAKQRSREQAEMRIIFLSRIDTGLERAQLAAILALLREESK